MRVITGKARGRRLETLSGDDVRPTTDTVKEAVFSIIQFSIEGRSFLDVFAGSGQMGIEALSRGAKKAVFVDKSRRSLEIIRKNIKTCGFEDDAEIIASDSLSYLSSVQEKFDLVFLDPPYHTGLLQAALEKVPPIMKTTGYIICEHPKEETLPAFLGEFQMKKSYCYGKIMITVYEHKEGKK